MLSLMIKVRNGKNNIDSFCIRKKKIYLTFEIHILFFPKYDIQISDILVIRTSTDV